VEGHLGAVKPRLVFFRWLRDGLPDFIRLHLAEQVACLGRSFDVVVIGEDCDYRDVCDRYQPDLTLFESGAYAGPRRITNAAAHPDIPKLGFIHSDAYCLSRAASISDMATWGVETFFTISVALGEYTPDIAGNLFVWPNFVDGDSGDVRRQPGNPLPVAEPDEPPGFTGISVADHAARRMVQPPAVGADDLWRALRSDAQRRHGRTGLWHHRQGTRPEGLRGSGGPVVPAHRTDRGHRVRWVR
jgi:hypothetical protein